jgi:hypothetical protein
MTALRAAAAAFKREEQKKEEQKRQVDFGSLRGAKRKRESEELVELTRLRKLDKVNNFWCRNAVSDSNVSERFPVFQLHC